MPQLEVRRIREEEVGTTPDAPAEMKLENYASFNVESTLKRTTPNNVNANRQRRGNPAEKIEVTGSASADLDLQGHLEENEEAFASRFTAPVAVEGSDIAASAAGNKLVKPGGWGGDIAVDSFLLVEGFGGADNHDRFLVRVAAVDGDDLRIHPSWMSVKDEAAGGAIKVWRTRDIRQGKEMLSSTAEQWSPQNGDGDLYPGLTTTKMVVKGSGGVMSVDYTYVGGDESSLIEDRLANPNAPVPVDVPASFEAHFADPLWAPHSQLGIRAGGAQLSDLRVDEFELSLENPALAKYGSGPGGAGIRPNGLLPDGEFDGFARLKCFRDGGDDIRELIELTRDPDAEEDFGISVVTPIGIRYWYLEAVNPAEGKSTEGVQKDGEDMATILLPARFKTHGMIHQSDFIFG